VEELGTTVCKAKLFVVAVLDDSIVGVLWIGVALKVGWSRDSSRRVTGCVDHWLERWLLCRCTYVSIWDGELGLGGGLQPSASNLGSLHGRL
jgi:hypothetical protein